MGSYFLIICDLIKKKLKKKFKQNQASLLKDVIFALPNHTFQTRLIFNLIWLDEL